MFETKGFCIVSWGWDLYEYATIDSAIIPALKEDHANSVVLEFFGGKMSGNYASEITYDPVANRELTTEANIISIVDKLYAIGIKHIEIHPWLLVQGGQMMTIQPSDVDAWFESYKAFISHWASFAESLKPKVDRFCFAHEIIAQSNVGKPEHDAKWRQVINLVRSKTTLPIGYHCATQEWVLETTSQRPTFLDAVDYINIATYLALVNKPNPTVEEIVNGWYGTIENPIPNPAWYQAGVNHVQQLMNFYNSVHKPIIVSEVSYGAFDGVASTNITYNPPSGAVADVQEQADCMEAFFRVFSKLSFIEGCNYYSMDTRDRGGDPADPTQYMSPYCNNKPIEQVIAKWYATPTPIPPILAITVGAGLGYAVGREPGAAIGALAGAALGSVSFKYRERLTRIGMLGRG
jgi:hypothetical protein